MKTLALIGTLSILSCGPKKVTLEEALATERYPAIDDEITEEDLEDLPETSDTGDNR